MDAYLYQDHQFISRNNIKYLGILGMQVNAEHVIFPQSSHFQVVLIEERGTDPKLCILDAIVTRSTEKSMGLTFQGYDEKTFNKLVYFIQGEQGMPLYQVAADTRLAV